jgi:putative Mg2+ transporter-C (MgtC) family protein
MISFQTIAVRLLVAVALGSLVGLERERGERAAGIRTHALVALGSGLIMIVSAFGFADILGTRAVVLDPSRIAAQVVSGIGFLGAGTILLRKEIIKGLTTAATIWMVAAIGLACGSGLLLEAGVATFLTMLVLVVLRPVRELLHRSATLHMLHIEADLGEESLLLSLCEMCRKAGLTIENAQIQSGRHSEKMDLECRVPDIAHLTRAIGMIRAMPEIQTVQLTLRRADLAGLTPSPFARRFVHAPERKDE